LVLLWIVSHLSCKILACNCTMLICLATTSLQFSSSRVWLSPLRTSNSYAVSALGLPTYVLGSLFLFYGYPLTQGFLAMRSSTGLLVLQRCRLRVGFHFQISLLYRFL
jgi:hypothetical protein